MSDHDLSAVLQLLEQLRPAIDRRERARLVEIIGQLVARRAALGEQWQALAQIAEDFGETGLGRRAIDLYVEAAGGSPVAQYRKAAFLAQVGAWREADALLRELPADVPDPASNAYSRGTAALTLGRSGEARDYLEHVLKLYPRSGSAWLALAMAVDLAVDGELADRLVLAGRDMAETTPASEQAALCYAIGKAHVERGAPDEAFAAFARGAALMKAQAAYDPAVDRAEAEEAIRGFDAARIADLAGRQREDTGRSIFVTGLPRSGTTLVEQILTSHSEVGEGAELNRLGLLASEIGGASWPALAGYVERHGIEPPARLWRHWHAERFPAPGRVVDKTVNTGRLLGLAATLLPDAPLVWVTRDPLDRAWSCFRTYFLGSMPWSYDLEDIARHFRVEDQLLERWQAVLGERLLVVPYEALIAEPEDWIRRLLAHCGLSEEPQVFAPHESQRPVTTASVMQVRRPIDRRAIGSAEPYRAFLAPFIDAYVEASPASVRS